jgi:hypothetical protein
MRKDAKDAMDDAASGKCRWELEREVGLLKGGGLAGRVDVSRPELGFGDVRVGARSLGGRWFCVKRDADTPLLEAVFPQDKPLWPLAVAEAYVRGADLVASYQPATDWPFAPQIYWRAGALDEVDGVVDSLSLLVSVQTHLLDTYPRIAVDSIFATAEAIHLTAGGGGCTQTTNLQREATFRPTKEIDCVVWRLTDAPFSYAEFMPASDFREFRWRHDESGNCRGQWELFAEFLEKGVIRRARLHGAFVRRENDLEIAAACCDAIERDALPLTA